mmetsp:Transcript_38757/g.109596  ORF Transcript_38757/g.109596 Transcript_38757/m.109596 type:complete len:551 (+) Transcript_38757:175-1827(+)
MPTGSRSARYQAGSLLLRAAQLCSPPSTPLTCSVLTSWQIRVEQACSLASPRASYGTAESRYDMLVIGGGSGGLACAKEAGKLGAKVALLDYVAPSHQGTSWGLGGTCVNVGCIPKKLMHQAGQMHGAFSDARGLGWAVPAEVQHCWVDLVQSVQNHVRSINFGYRVELRSKRVDYINASGALTGPNTVVATSCDGSSRTLSADRIVLAVGGRPSFPDAPGARELCLTSDDIFSLDRSPGRTLVVGGSYIALETAGFLSGLGFDTTVMARSILLRGFDQQIAELIGKNLEAQHGVRIMKGVIPQKFEAGSCGSMVKCTWQANGAELSEEFDTVLLAVGRRPATSGLGLPQAGVEVDTASGKITVREDDSTSVPHIFAIGDAALGRPELTPTAIQAGRLLARRLFGGSSELMRYNMVPTTVFTPLEYSCVGLSEEAACLAHQNVEVYHSFFKPLEWAINHEELPSGAPVRPDNACYVKIVTVDEQDQPVVGLHYLGPNAGEVMQGFSLAMSRGITRRDLENTIAIHPTTAEEVTAAFVTKSSGLSALKTSC